jgi:hypothetical protein
MTFSDRPNLYELSKSLSGNYFSINNLVRSEAWSLTLWEEHRLRVFENRVLRRIVGPKRDEVTGGWRILHNDELHNLYSLPNIIRMIKSRKMRWAGHGEDEKCIQNFG